jgi:hypothetical protein
MNPNPPMGGPPGPSGNAKDMVNIPSMLLIIVGAIGALFALYSTIMAFTGGNNAAMAQLANNPDMAKYAAAGSPVVNGLVGLLQVAVSGLAVFGGLKMRNLQSFGLAMGGAIAAVIPCLGPCCCLGIPFGIWALIVLNKPEVKSSFTA